MDTSSVSRVLIPSDVVAPQAAAKAPHAEIPDQAVPQIEETKAASLNARRQDSASQDLSSKRERAYVYLPDQTFVFQISDKKTGFKLVQIPSEEAVKLRAYLAQQETVKSQRREEASEERFDIVA